MKPNDVETANRLFYDSLYGGRSTLGHLLRAIVSFDQRSKAGPNLEAVRRIIEREGGKKRAAVLDYGCGWGTLLLMLPRGSVELHGYDLSPSAMVGLQRVMRLLGRRLHSWDPHAAPEHFLDILVCSHVLEHVDDDLALLRRFRDWLKPGGYAVLNVPINEVIVDPKHMRRYTETDFETLVEQAGFEVVESTVTDRWTSFFLANEQDAPLTVRFALRSLRGLLAVLPWRIVRALGRVAVNPQHHPQQLIVVGRVSAPE